MSNEKAAPIPEDERGHDGLTSAERLQEMMRPCQPYWKDERIATLTAEVAALKGKCDLLRDNHPFGPMYDALCKAQNENAALKAEIARLSAPVSNSEFIRGCDQGRPTNGKVIFDRIILARATPPQSGGKE